MEAIQKAKILTSEDRRRIEHYLHNNDPQMCAALALVYHNFLAPLEISRIKRQDIDLRRQRIDVRLGRESHKAQISICCDVQQALIHADVERMYHTEFLIGHKLNKSQISIGAFVKRYGDHLAQIGLSLKDAGFNILRDTGVHDLYYRRFDVQEINRLLRHATIETTIQYLATLGIEERSEAWEN